MLSIFVNDRPIHVAAIVEHGRALVPLRAVAEATGASVWYDGKHHRVVISNHGERVVLRPRIVRNHAYVPLRFVAERVGASVNYVARANRVDIVTHIPIAYGVEPPAPAFQTAPPIPPPSPQYGEAAEYPQFNFYTTNGRAYFPGDWIHFVLIAPAGGTAWLRLCNGSNQYELWNGGNGSRYVVDVPAPYGFNIPNCRVDVAYTSFNGVSTWVPIPFYIGLYTAPGIAPQPRPTPRRISPPPVMRRPEPTPVPTIAPPPTLAPTTPPILKPVRTREPRPRQTP